MKCETTEHTVCLVQRKNIQPTNNMLLKHFKRDGWQSNHVDKLLQIVGNIVSVHQGQCLRILTDRIHCINDHLADTNEVLDVTSLCCLFRDNATIGTGNPTKTGVYTLQVDNLVAKKLDNLLRRGPREVVGEPRMRSRHDASANFIII